MDTSSFINSEPKTVVLWSIAAFFLYQSYLKWVVPLWQPLHNIRGPKGESVLFGHDLKIFANDGDDWIEKQFKEFGPVWRYKTMFNVDAVYVGDTIGMSAILGSHDLRWPLGMRGVLLGMIKTTGATHHHLRKQLSPFFNTATMRGCVPIMQEVADKMFALWRKTAAVNPGKSIEIDGYQWMSRVGMEIMVLRIKQGKRLLEALLCSNDPSTLSDQVPEIPQGLTFNTIDTWEPSLSAYGRALSGWFMAGTLVAMFVPYSTQIDAWTPQWLADLVATLRVPVLKDVIIGNRQLKQNAIELIAKKEADIREGAESSAKDIISLSVRANMKAPADQKLAPEELQDEVSAVILAGHEATSGVLAGIYYQMANNPEIQKKLRTEVMEAFDLTGGNFDHDQLQALPYLDAIVKEALRIYFPGDIFRTAEKDVVIPLVNRLLEKDGKVITELDIKKGTVVFSGMTEWNNGTHFGEDPKKFIPERWIDTGLIKRESPETPGVFANLLSFGSGPHHCIGYRFAICSIKSVIATTVRHVSLSPAPTTKYVTWCHGPSRFPAVLDPVTGVYTRGCPVVITHLEDSEMF